MNERSAYTRFVSNVAFPLHERLKRHSTTAIRQELEATQWWPRDRLAAWQAARLQALFMHAATFVPYYRDVFKEHGFNAASVQSVADLARLPFLTKEVVRANADRLRSDGARNLTRLNTGGSSGEPLIFYVGKERVSHDVAAKWRATRWWGVDVGDREIVVWGSPVELGTQDRLKRLRDRILRTELLPAFEMSETKLDRFVERIRIRRPTMLFGYPSSLALIARHAERRGVILHDLGTKVAFVTSERLYDHQRQQIERTFGCRVANGYGGRDAGFVAHQCPEGGMHITAEDIVVEIIDPSGRVLAAGESGEIVVTHLATKDFPFIRYRTGDIGVLDDRACKCGRGLPVLKDIEGRSTDFVVAADGTVMHGLALIYVMRDLPDIESFRIVQESPKRTRVMLVPRAGFGTATEEAIRNGLRGRLGAGVAIDIQCVQQIPAERSGKFRYVLSHVPVR
jgi:phenylacetate-CoA ligase